MVEWPTPGEELREDWERRQRAALLPFDHPFSGPRGRERGVLRVFRWLLIAYVALMALSLIGIAIRAL